MRFLLIFLVLIGFSCNLEEVIEENRKAKWIEDAFETLHSEDYPNIHAISWWHENFDGSKLRIDSSPESLEAYKKGLTLLNISQENIFLDGVLQFQTAIYHSAFPDFGGTEDIVTSQGIIDFENLVGSEISWAYFSNNWLDEIVFPNEAVSEIDAIGRLPFIRMMARSNFEEGGPDPIYSMQKIIEGYFDNQLEQWAIDAANSGVNLAVEFGTEVNGDWFSWNGLYNGGGATGDYGDPDYPDGPERFRDAYRHIIDICNENGALNITWFFHVDAYSSPEIDWNSIEKYYPGDDYIDWLGVSIYGAQTSEDEYQLFSEIIYEVYPQLESIADKPIAILEFGVTE